MSPPKLITEPASEPVTLAEAKAHLRVDHDDENDLIELLISAARRYCERFQGRAFIDQTWDLYLDAFPSAEIKIPMPPLIEIVSVKYDDGNGAEQTLAADSYVVDAISEPGWVVPSSAGWPATFNGINSVRVRYRAGYIDASNSPPTEGVPDDTKAAILLILGTLYAHRETVMVGSTAIQMPWSAEQLLRRRRIDLSMA